MGKFNYKAAQKTALRLIDKFGQIVVLARVTSTYDEVTGQNTVTGNQTTNATVVTLPSSSGTGVQAFDNKFREDVKKGKIRFFYVAAKGLDFHPEPGDLFEFENKIWELAGATPLNPAGIPVLFTVGAKVSNLSTIPAP